MSAETIQRLDELDDRKKQYVIDITNRCIDLYPAKFEGVAKDILYLHNEDKWVHNDPELVRLLSELKELEEEIFKINPYDRWVDENS